MPPPQGFSQASFSSRTNVSRPALASFSAAKAPAGPPPNTATLFITASRASAVLRSAGSPVDVQEVGLHPEQSRHPEEPCRLRAGSHHHRPRPTLLSSPLPISCLARPM